MASGLEKYGRRHGHTAGGLSLTYNAWRAMIDRCTGVNNNTYEFYGAKGIAICEGWNDFRQFLKDVGERPSRGHTLDRIDNDGNYEPGNCRWATRKEQARNRKSNRIVEAFGEALPIAEWADRLGVPQHRIGQRIRRGWPPERALAA